MKKNVIVGTAGHIDHGKSALVEALTGTHPDRLEEEKRRGITIDLGFAFLETGEVTFGFVDVPGHERFIRNMLAGAGGIDLVLLVVAADEGIKPQTREHFDICRLLGIERGIVVITKADLAEPDVVGLVKLEIEEYIHGSFLEGAPIVVVSARTGAGLAELKNELARAAGAVPPRDLSAYARLPIDRVFAMKGFGTVVTGTLISGTLRADQEIELLPLDRRLRIRGLHSGGRAVALAEAGQRTAVNLSDIAVADIQRGMALAAPGLFRATQRVDARLSLLPSARPLKRRARVHFHQGTAETIADVAILGANQLAPGQSALAQLRLDSPVFMLPGDRFIIRQFSPVETIGGGVVLDALAPRHKQDDSCASVFLGVLEAGSTEEVLDALAEEAPGGLSLPEIIARTGWLESAIRANVQALTAEGKIRAVSREPLIVTSEARFSELLQRTLHEVEDFHEANPLVPGISKEELRGRAASRVRPEMFRSALDELVATGKLQATGDLVQKAGREIALSPEEAQAKDRIAKEFEAAGLAVPSVTEVLARLPVDSRRAQKLIQMLLREKTLIKVADGLVFHQSAVEKLRGLLAEYKRRCGDKLPIAAFKEMAGISRKYAIPLLEFLDRERLTRRVGDERVIL